MKNLLVAEHFPPKMRFLAGLTLADIYHRLGKDAFIQNARFVNFSNDEIQAILEHLNLPVTGRKGVIVPKLPKSA